MAVRAAGWCFASEAAQILGIKDRWAEEYERVRDADLDLAVVVAIAGTPVSPSREWAPVQWVEDEAEFWRGYVEAAAALAAVTFRLVRGGAVALELMTPMAARLARHGAQAGA